MQRRAFIQAGLAAASGTLAGTGHGEDIAFPNRPVTVVVPCAGGGSADVIVRGMAQELSRMWRPNVVADNKAGGNTVIATSHVIASPLDGYTILCGSYAWVTNQYLGPKLPYAPSALAPVTLLGRYPGMLYVRGDLPVRDVAELAAYAKASGRSPNFANSGPGSSLHLAAVAFADAAGIPARTCPIAAARRRCRIWPVAR